jgi:uncharacterized protein (TIGR02001 family)
MKSKAKFGFAAALMLASGLAQADWSANIGFASEYYFRGIFQKQSSASAGLDFESGGFYAGTWAADVGDGLEVDGYFGYGLDVGEVSLSAGFTGYYYTGDFDDTYQEINLGAGLGIFSLDVAIGEYANFSGPTQDYTYYALTAEHNGFYGKYAGFSQDADGDYIELGYGTTVSDIDLGIYLLFNSEELAGDVNDDGDSESDINLIFTIGKSFDL